MPLTEIQKTWLTKEVLYRNTMSMITGLDNQINSLRNKLEYLNLVSASDLTALAVPAETQTLLASMRTELADLITYYDTNFAAIADQMRTM